MKFYLGILLVTFGIGLAVQATSAAWSVPSGVPSTGTNVEAPLNESAASQAKAGGLSLGTASVVGTMYVKGSSGIGSPTGDTTLEVEDNIGGSEYCNQDGSICFTAAEMSTLVSSL